MAHRDAVINGDGIKFLGDTASLTNRAGNQLTHILQVHVARHELSEGVRDSNNGLAEVVIAHDFTRGVQRSSAQGHFGFIHRNAHEPATAYQWEG